ncbi:hypothetical protein KXD40_007811 [Peronospora effusa]|nr:hypothetical protein KXD40_007811 [Peronospora effusa]
MSPLYMMQSVLRHGSSALTMEAVALSIASDGYIYMYRMFLELSGEERKPRSLRPVNALNLYMTVLVA